MFNDEKQMKPSNQVSKNTRRSFLRKAAVGAPVIVAASAKPSWATTHCTVSGTMSGNLSNNQGTTDQCATASQGEPPTYWHGKQAEDNSTIDLSGTAYELQQVVATRENLRHGKYVNLTSASLNGIQDIINKYPMPGLTSEELSFLETLNGMSYVA